MVQFKKKMFTSKTAVARLMEKQLTLDMFLRRATYVAPRNQYPGDLEATNEIEVIVSIPDALAGIRPKRKKTTKKKGKRRGLQKQSKNTISGKDLDNSGATGGNSISGDIPGNDLAVLRSDPEQPKQGA